jgi:hypothetical protein
LFYSQLKFRRIFKELFCPKIDCGLLGGWPNDPDHLHLVDVAMFRLWARNRMLAEGAHQSGLQYRLCTCNVTFRILCHDGTEDRITIQNAVNAYGGGKPVKFDAVICSAVELRRICNHAQFTLLVGSMAAICKYAAHVDPSTKIDSLLFGKLSETFTSEYMWRRVPGSIRIADYCIIPWSGVSTLRELAPAVSDETSSVDKFLSPVPAFGEVPILQSEEHLKTLSRHWMIDRCLPKNSAPWELVKAWGRGGDRVF